MGSAGSLAREFKLGQPGPALVVLLVHLQEVVHCVGSRLQQVTRLEHESQIGVRNLVGFLLTGHELFVGICIGAVRSHRGVQGRASRSESFSLCVVLPADVAHELGHAVPVVVWRLEGVLGHQPAGWEDHEVQRSSAASIAIYPSIADLEVRTVNMQGSG